MSAESRLAHALADEQKATSKDPDPVVVTQNLRSALSGFIAKGKQVKAAQAQANIETATAPPPVVESP